MDCGDGSKSGCLHSRIPVYTFQYAIKRYQTMDVLFINVSIEIQRGTRTNQPEIMKGYNGWDTILFCDIKYRWGSKRKKVMNMNDVRLKALNGCFYSFCTLAVINAFCNQH